MLRPATTAKRIFSLLLCVVTVLLLAFPATAADSETTAVRHAAAVYHRATTASTVIGCMELGTELTVLETRGDFYKIDCYDMVGYIPKSSVLAFNGKYFVSYSKDESQRRDFAYLSFAQSIPLTSQLYTTAVAQQGVRYRLGGTTPRGFDCSGFTHYVYAQSGIALQRTCEKQIGEGIIVAKEDLRPGDLIFFDGTNHPTALVTHVGMYIGDGKLIHAGSAGITIVDLDHQYFARHYLCARRIVLTEEVVAETLTGVASANVRTAEPARKVQSRAVLSH